MENVEVGVIQHRTYLVLASQSAEPCGVEQFARSLKSVVGNRALLFVLSFKIRCLANRVGQGCILIVNFPLVAWKRKLIEPIIAAVIAKCKGGRVLLIMHEWNDLDWKRRASYIPMLLLSDLIAFSSPEVKGQLLKSWFSNIVPARQIVIPIPPTLRRPAAVHASKQSGLIRRKRLDGRLIIGHFGSIYPKKQSMLVLDVAYELKKRGLRPYIVYIGSFIAGRDLDQETFQARIRKLGLQDDVEVTGFIETSEDIYAIFAEISVFVYMFAEGLTSRRTSVLACAASGRPVVVNSPDDLESFVHHPSYRKLVSDGTLKLVDRHASIKEVADAVRDASTDPSQNNLISFDQAWGDVLCSLEKILGGSS